MKYTHEKEQLFMKYAQEKNKFMQHTYANVIYAIINSIQNTSLTIPKHVCVYLVCL